MERYTVILLITKENLPIKLCFTISERFQCLKKFILKSMKYIVFYMYYICIYINSLNYSTFEIEPLANV